ncbi:MAG: hypothetical protein JNN03_11430 [Rubrivivax sp.]|nr:hypothetical protein [Rubrivivax sp.]
MHRASAPSPRHARVAPLPSWRRLLPAADTMFALFAIAAALVVFADFAATF